MPELMNRSRHEQELETAVWLVMQKQLKRLAADPRNLPWAAWEAELAQAMVDPLAGTYIESAEQLAKSKDLDLDDEEIRSLAKLWALGYVMTLAREITANTREMGIASLKRAETQGTALADELAGTFGRARAENIAITETTRVSVIGERVAIDKLLAARTKQLGAGLAAGLLREPTTEVAFWYTEADGRVCPICAPLHGEPEGDWPPPLDKGPPAHPRCRCWVTWKTVARQKGPLDMTDPNQN